MSATEAPPFDVRDPAFLANPYPVFHRLRTSAPVYRAPLGRWFITRYDDVAQLLRDRRFGKDYADPDALMRRFGPTALQEPAVVELTHMMLMRDPPDHTRLRGLVVKAFTARRIEAMRARVQDLTDRLLDKVIPLGRMDMIRDLAFPLPVLVICELLGIPEEDQVRFVTGSSTGAALLNPTPPSRTELDDANRGSLESGAYFEALFEQRRRDPRDDLVTQLVQAEEAGDRLTTAELRANVNLLFAAGHETTVNLIGNGFLSLLRHPEQWRLLRDNPSLISNAIEEILRFESPVQAVARTVAEPVELSGVVLEPPAIVVALIGAANRDPAVFGNPDRFDITREDIRPLSFGGGIHFCLGAQLARIEAAVVFETVLRRLPDLRLEKPDQPKWRSSFTLRGLTELPVAWG
ncbi:cytochrome P450 [Acidisphaera sp. S103]|uniref:cytochrome P450 n=1 Tax=Acidisphaera sp. S103 TaxID=1747223 RepID=UPI00131BABF2|nr:cytochrome P450 [Acidisphaera sp. S103]